jgi:lysophospholipase L1-like esterase
MEESRVRSHKIKLRIESSFKVICLLLWAALAAGGTKGQSLSISKKADSNFWIQASAPAGNPHTLQASENFHLWIDVTNDVTDEVSSMLDYARIGSRFYRLTPSAPEAPPIRVLVVGDSLASDCCGWGSGMYGYFKPNAAFINYGQPQTSSRTFIQSVEFQQMLLIKPDYVLFQFGWTDGSIDPDRNAYPDQFEANLRTIINTIRGYGGVPIPVTIHAMRQWDENGKLIPWDHMYNPITRRVAAEMNTPLIDLQKMTIELFNELGQSGSDFMKFTPFPGDTIHFSPEGAVYVARLVAKALPDSVGPYLTGIFDPPPKP